MDTNTNKWSSYGVEILSDSNLTHSHCVSSHLTTFAGGFIVLPNAIDFNYVWANASFLQNPVIYSTVIALICLYILLAVWARWMDKKDEDKCGITLIGNMKDHMKIEQRYIYEIICFTGNRLNAGTKSKVQKKKFLFFTGSKKDPGRLEKLVQNVFFYKNFSFHFNTIMTETNSSCF
jgi:hypothetical protein